MQDFLQTLPFIEKACQEVMLAKKCYYSNQDIWKQLTNYPNLQFEILPDGNIPLFLITQRSGPGNSTCIIYLHGLASYSIEGKFLIQHLKQNFALCLYDQRGHGKNNSPYITYGLDEAEDLCIFSSQSDNVISRLKCYGFQRFVLWGRSMGAVTALRLMLIKPGAPLLSKIKGLVLDSPFASFQKVAIEVICRRMYIPQFLAKLFLKAMLKNILEKYGYDMRQLDCSDCKTIKVPTLIIYSPKDEIISPDHAFLIYASLNSEKELLKTNSCHNQSRSESLVSAIFTRLRKYVNRNTKILKLSGKRGIQVTKEARNQSFSWIDAASSILSVKGFDRILSPTSTDSKVGSWTFRSGQYSLFKKPFLSLTQKSQTAQTPF